MPDPKLKEAMEEIKVVLKKYDIGAIVMLSSPTHMEYLQEYSPSWSCIRFEETPDGQKAIRIRAVKEEFPNKQAWQKCLNDSGGLLLGFVDLMNFLQEQTGSVITLLAKQTGSIEHISKHEEPPEGPRF